MGTQVLTYIIGVPYNLVNMVQSVMAAPSLR